jgi:hypothetical protein
VGNNFPEAEFLELARSIFGGSPRICLGVISMCKFNMSFEAL